MSLVPSDPAGLPALPDDSMVGLEDFDPDDLVIPRLTIDHDTAELVDGLTGERFPEVTAVLLGMVKQRVLWPAEQSDDKQPPLCKSYDGASGNPGDKFPWAASGYDQPAADQSGCLACSACALKEWDSHPNRNVPWCTEQHAFPLLLDSGPAILTLQRSSMKDSRAYVSSFVRAKTPMFTALTRISLTQHRRGKVDYAITHFAKVGPTDQGNWPEYANQFRSMRTFLVTPRTDDASSEAEAVPVATGPAPSRVSKDGELPY